MQLRRQLWVRVFVVLVGMWCCHAPALEAFDGLSFKTKLLALGKADAHYRHTDDTDEYNVIWWSSIFKGGAGVTDFETKRQTNFGGGYLRPLLPWPRLGELIIGAQRADSATSHDQEVQGEYRFPFGLGVGAGYVERGVSGPEVVFEKLSYRTHRTGWNAIVEAQSQTVDGVTSPGGYIALYDDQLMVTYGNDGEQWRSAVGFIAPETTSMFRPVAEFLYTDNAIGHLDGTQSIFANASLKYQGGFLSHPARLGRAMGPTGSEFGNPLGFLDPTWNRRLDVWELGALGDARVVWTKTDAGVITWRADALMFPFQFDRANNVLDSLFIGGFYSGVKGKDSPGILGGLFRQIGFLQVGAALDYNFDTDEKRIDVGIIDKF